MGTKNDHRMHTKKRAAVSSQLSFFIPYTWSRWAAPIQHISALSEARNLRYLCYIPFFVLPYITFLGTSHPNKEYIKSPLSLSKISKAHPHLHTQFPMSKLIPFKERAIQAQREGIVAVVIEMLREVRCDATWLVLGEDQSLMGWATSLLIWRTG